MRWFYQDKTFPYKYNSDKSYVELNKKFFNDYINNLYTICEATFCVNKIFNHILNKENWLKCRTKVEHLHN